MRQYNKRQVEKSYEAKCKKYNKMMNNETKKLILKRINKKKARVNPD
jgi:hypothetical protein